MEEFLSSTPSHCSTRVMYEGSPKHRTASAFPKSVQIQGKRKIKISGPHFFFSSLSLSAGEEVNESKIKARSQCDGREEEDGGGEEEAESKEKKTSCSQEHLLAQRKESNYNLTKSPSTGLTKYLTGSLLFPESFFFSLSSGSYARQEWKATLTVCVPLQNQTQMFFCTKECVSVSHFRLVWLF